MLDFGFYLSGFKEFSNDCIEIWIISDNFRYN